LLAEQWVVAHLVRSWKQRLPEIVAEYHQQHHLRHGMPRATLQTQLSDKLAPKGFEILLKWAVDNQLIVINRDLIASPGWQPKPSEGEMTILEKIEKFFRKAGFEVKNNKDVLIQLGYDGLDSETYLSYLALEGSLVRLNQDSSLHADNYRKAEKMLIDILDQQGEFSLAEFRDKLGSGRKLVQALLEYFDGLKFTRRVGEKRVAWQLPQAG